MILLHHFPCEYSEYHKLGRPSPDPVPPISPTSNHRLKREGAGLQPALVIQPAVFLPPEDSYPKVVNQCSHLETTVSPVFLS